ncbi:MAG: DNA polymerase III subunit gamma/tau, partial [Alphaproteobacteria bacterium]|nr:DNA polymerase III subunit gamma/tau [Alphaproteobacteria bacterium]
MSDPQPSLIPDIEPAPDKGTPGKAGGAGTYRVLARTYRPQKFSELIGQEALVRTLANAMRTGRIAHAFLLTGIRGVGKTTTARIIARALNCIGEDGKGEPTPEPCGACEHCRAIADGRHIDILEMDAATHTGIDDIRELVDSVRYAPTSARYKVYIVDEVHMLSEKAFNGLLKTLEEPPPQTLFIFATTEVRKVPITVLSRCQRFDLRRIESDVLARYFQTIAARENIEIDDGALALICRAAEGSARDGLSLLDQAIALSGGAAITAEQVQDMLGLADRSRVLDLHEQIMRGQINQALAGLGDLFDRGSEPESVVQDLLEISHWLTRLKVAGDDDEVRANAWDAERGKAMASALSHGTLSRAWQMLLKGLDDLRIAPSPLVAAEMLIIRLAHAADLPTAEVLLGLSEPNAGGNPGAGSPGGGKTSSDGKGSGGGGHDLAAAKPSQPAPKANGLEPKPNGRDHEAPASTPPPPSADAPSMAPASADKPQPVRQTPVNGVPAAPAAPVGCFEDAVHLFKRHDKPLLHGWLHGQARLVHFAPGLIELEKGDMLLAERRQEMAALLKEWTGQPWQIVESDHAGAPSLTEQ